jgi:hypothetical protein
LCGGSVTTGEPITRPGQADHSATIAIAASTVAVDVDPSVELAGDVRREPRPSTSDDS